MSAVPPEGARTAARGALVPVALFVWFRVPREHEASAAMALRELHATWLATMPGLSCELMRRVEDHADEITLMEIYRAPDGVPAHWQTRIEREGNHHLAALVGSRHVEVFAPCA